MSAEFLMVTTTVADRDEAMTLGRGLVESRLAACVQVLPIDSIYRWDGAVADASEHLLLCKIRAVDFAAVEAEIMARHAYEVPEIVAVSIAAGSPGYLAWLGEATTR